MKRISSTLVSNFLTGSLASIAHRSLGEVDVTTTSRRTNPRAIHAVLGRSSLALHSTVVIITAEAVGVSVLSVPLGQTLGSINSFLIQPLEEFHHGVHSSEEVKHCAGGGVLLLLDLVGLLRLAAIAFRAVREVYVAATKACPVERVRERVGLVLRCRPRNLPEG